jgi:hypothetical protein
MINKAPIILLIYLPWLLAHLFKFDPKLSFFTAWIGSFFIFYISISSSLAPLNTNKNFLIPVMKPIVLIQIIFAGFMCCTSIFYFLQHIDGAIETISECQRLSLLAHSSLVTGMILMIKNDNQSQSISFSPTLSLVSGICIIAYLSSKGLVYITPLIQFKYPLQLLSITTGVYVIIKGTAERHLVSSLIGVTMFSIHFIESTLTGFKEGIIVQILILAFVGFHYYRKFVLLTAVPALIIALYILPTYANIMRTESWTKGRPATSARTQAYQTFFAEENDHLIMENNYQFLTNRFSEIGMFVKYVKHTPDHQDFTGSEIFKNILTSLIPRFLWDDKPITEHVAMERVYEAGVISRFSNVSAKTRPVVDGYLMAGTIGVFVLMLSYGMITQIISNTAERLFGGYEMGGILIFNSLFQQLWRGNSLEFLVNNIICGLILMLVIYALMKALNLLSSTIKS